MKYLVANWKMNSVDLDLWEKKFLKVIDSEQDFPKSHEVKLIVCLNLYDYQLFSKKIQSSKNQIFQNIILYAQDVSRYEEGAHTGQISSHYLKNIGLEAVSYTHLRAHET